VEAKMQLRYMLDTNTASYIIKGHPASVQRHLLSVPIEQVCISVITEAELLFGMARKPDAKDLHITAHEFLLRVDILPWDSKAALQYGKLRAALEERGKVLGNMDMMIAAHALAMDSVLVTTDKSFRQVKQLSVVDWTKS
jgi:tRNA(fMet)-specific endonuclease VapC